MKQISFLAVLMILTVVICRPASAQFLKRSEHEMTTTAENHVVNDAGKASGRKILREKWKVPLLRIRGSILN